jgi:hypothetical protein
MKTMKLFFFLMMLMFIAACTKEGLLSPDSLIVPGGENTFIKNGHCGEVFTVKPNGYDDTENLIAAFESAKTSGPGSTVHLTKGKYIIGFIEVRDFDGYLTGEGKGKTLITNKPGLPCEAAWERNVMPALMTFIGGNIVISHLSFHLTDGEPCVRGPINDAIYGDLCSIVVLADYSSEYVPDNRHINGIIDNVDFIAGNDGGYGTYGTPGNVGMALYCGSDLMFITDFMPLTTGKFSVTNCNFENAMVGPDFWALDGNSEINVDNTSISGGAQQIFIGSLMGTKVSIKDNKFLNGTYIDLFIWGGDFGYFPGILPDKPTSYVIRGNNFHSSPGVVSLFMRDEYRTVNPEEVFPQLFDVNNNVFRTSDGDHSFPNTFGIAEGGMAIQAWNLRDATFRNNKFNGSGLMGALINGDEISGTYAEKVKLTGNNFTGTYYTDAAVYLGPYTRNCTVAGVSKDNILDEGVNNTVIGTRPHKPGVHHGKYFHNNFKSGQENFLPKRFR